MKIYFIEEHLHRQVFHGGIGNVDAENIFLQKGFIPIRLPCHFDFSWKAKLFRLLYLMKTLAALPSGAWVIFQFPLYARLDRLLVSMFAVRRSVRVICFLTDIDGLKNGDEVLLRKEITQLRRFHYFIVHNEAMKQWLLSKTSPRGTAVINFFDFLAKQADAPRKKSFEVAFAGNLQKSNFLLSLETLGQVAPQLIFNVYGKDPSVSLIQQANVRYRGFQEPHLLPAGIEGSFGLVWDGDSVDLPAGSLGSYMKYISHHKLSLYIVSGMPLIVWSSGAAAALVAKYKIGISINSLFELQDAIAAVTEDEYQLMAGNMKDIAGLITTGQMLGRAVDDITSGRAVTR